MHMYKIQLKLCNRFYSLYVEMLHLHKAIPWISVQEVQKGKRHKI